MHLQSWWQNPAMRGVLSSQAEKGFRQWALAVFYLVGHKAQLDYGPRGLGFDIPDLVGKKRLQGLSEAVDKNHNVILTHGSVKCFLWFLNHILN